MHVHNILLNYTAPNGGKTIIEKLDLFGDSLTDADWKGVAPGTYYKVPNPKNHWSAILERELQIPVSNHGIAGDSAINIATGSNTRIADVIAGKPSHCMLMIGGNDIYGGQTPTQIMANINIIVQALKAANITVILMWCHIGTSSASSVAVGTQITRINEMPVKYQEYATANNLQFINFRNTVLFSNGVNSVYYLTDEIHVNTKGHPVMANYILQQLGVL